MICPHCLNVIADRTEEPLKVVIKGKKYKIAKSTTMKGFLKSNKWCKPIPLLIVKKG